MPSPQEAVRVLKYFESNRVHLGPWDPDRAPAFYSESYWETRLTDNVREFTNDESAHLFLYRIGHQEVIGTVNFNSIVRGCFQACYLGYGLDSAHEGKGLMFEALTAALDFAFNELRLHRVMANYQPQNHRSGKLLGRLGFQEEGLARNYLFLNGAFRDHVLTAKTNPSYVFPPPEPP